LSLPANIFATPFPIPLVPPVTNTFIATASF
jgi:hypothetical protein